MYDELVKRLKEEASNPDTYPEDFILMRKAADAIEELADRNVGKWIPVTERLPEECGWYLANVFSHGVQWGEITTKDSEWIQLVFYHEGKFHKLTGSNAKVTHWMPLPEPPKAEEGE